MESVEQKKIDIDAVRRHKNGKHQKNKDTVAKTLRQFGIKLRDVHAKPLSPKPVKRYVWDPNKAAS